MISFFEISSKENFTPRLEKVLYPQRIWSKSYISLCIVVHTYTYKVTVQTAIPIQ